MGAKELKSVMTLIVREQLVRVMLSAGRGGVLGGVGIVAAAADRAMRNRRIARMLGESAPLINGGAL